MSQEDAILLLQGKLCSMGVALVWDSATSSSPCDQRVLHPVQIARDAPEEGLGRQDCRRGNPTRAEMGRPAKAGLNCTASLHAVVAPALADGTEALLLASILPQGTQAGQVSRFLLFHI